MRTLQAFAQLAVLVAAFRPVFATVILQTGNITFDPIASLPADFGPLLALNGVTGLLYVAEPEDGCIVPETPKHLGGRGWIALLRRTQGENALCTFDVKVRNAEAAGAIGAIIHDQAPGPLIIMSKPFGQPDPGIPAVFISQKSGILLKQLLNPGVSIVTITAAADSFFADMLGTLGMCLVFSILMALWLARRQQGDGPILSLGGGGPGTRGGMSDEAIRALPIIVYQHGRTRPESGDEGDPGEPERDPAECEGPTAGDEPESSSGSASASSVGSFGGPACGGSTSRACAICLDNYVDGDKLRILPCRHRFHAACIDQWLSQRTTLCPVCKGDAAAIPQDAPPEEGADEGADAAARETRPAAGWQWARRLLGSWRGTRGPAVSSAWQTEEQQLLELEAGDRSEDGHRLEEIVPAPSRPPQ